MTTRRFKRAPKSVRMANRAKGLTKTQAKSVRKIAQNTTLRLCETKAVGTQSPGSPTIPAQALFHNQAFFPSRITINETGYCRPE